MNKTSSFLTLVGCWGFRAEKDAGHVTVQNDWDGKGLSKVLGAFFAPLLLLFGAEIGNGN